MAQPKKRFPYKFTAGAAILLIGALLSVAIATVGRQGTIASRYEQIQKGMSPEEVVAIMGKPDEDQFRKHHGVSWEDYTFRDGAAEVWILFSAPDQFQEAREPPVDVSVHQHKEWVVRIKSLSVHGSGFISWHFRRWAEQAYTAIHGPRR